jgi:hypothetical protein
MGTSDSVRYSQGFCGYYYNLPPQFSIQIINLRSVSVKELFMILEYYKWYLKLPRTDALKNLMCGIPFHLCVVY